MGDPSFPAQARPQPLSPTAPSSSGAVPTPAPVVDVAAGLRGAAPDAPSRSGNARSATRPRRTSPGTARRPSRRGRPRARRSAVPSAAPRFACAHRIRRDTTCLCQLCDNRSTAVSTGHGLVRRIGAERTAPAARRALLNDTACDPTSSVPGDVRPSTAHEPACRCPARRRARALPALRPHRHAVGARLARRTRARRSSSTSPGCSPTSCARSGSTTSS